MKIKEMLKEHKMAFAIIGVGVVSFFIGNNVGVNNTCALIRETLSESELNDLVEALNK